MQVNILTKFKNFYTISFRLVYNVKKVYHADTDLLTTARKIYSAGNVFTSTNIIHRTQQSPVTAPVCQCAPYNENLTCFYF